jgi:6-phosphogluconolactonase
VTPQPVLDIAADAHELADRAAAWLAQRINETPGPVALALSGGATPNPVYERLGGADFQGRVDWGKVHLFWSDERFVPSDHKDSNFRMAFESLISRAPIPAKQIHAIPTDLGSPNEAAASYAATLQRYYGSPRLDPERPLFAITLLGLGADGHIASLFPGSAALEEREAWAVSVIGAKPEPRISLTYPALESSGVILFLVAGAQKRDALARTLANDGALPAARLATRGAIQIIADRAAAAN